MYVFVCVSREILLLIFQLEHRQPPCFKLEFSFVKERKNRNGLDVLHLQDAVNSTAQEPKSESVHKKAGKRKKNWESSQDAGLCR